MYVCVIYIEEKEKAFNKVSQSEYAAIIFFK